MELSKEQKLLSTILNEVWGNEAFKSDLLTNPVKAIERLTGQEIKLPEGKTLVVNDQSNPSIVYLNIPAKPDIEDMELDEEQLDIISGGGDPTSPILSDTPGVAAIRQIIGSEPE